jgi:hypothetical protein
VKRATRHANSFGAQSSYIWKGSARTSFQSRSHRASTSTSPSGFFGAFAHGAAFADGAAASAPRYAAAAPFPHIVLDGMFRPELLRAVSAEIPSPFTERDRLGSRDVPGFQERKFFFRDAAALGPQSTFLIASLSSTPFLTYLTALTGIAGLIPDPYLDGAGFHQIIRGGKLIVHADFNVHPIMHAYRRLNLLLYLNPNWRAEWGGDLELWPPEMRAPGAVIAPLFNRTVIFNTTDTSYHGHPHPLDCPPDVVRRSLALYYYTVERLRPDEHSTLWQELPEP